MPWIRAGVEIVNAVDCRTWASFTKPERQHRHFVASSETAQRSQAIKKALSGKQAGPDVDLAPRQKRGAAAGARNADRRARALADVVHEIVECAGDQPVSDAHLGRALNDRGVVMSRGGKWSSTTAKRLRQRLRVLGLVND
jgi:hypothetical protein